MGEKSANARWLLHPIFNNQAMHTLELSDVVCDQDHIFRSGVRGNQHRLLLIRRMYVDRSSDNFSIVVFSAEKYNYAVAQPRMISSSVMGIMRGCVMGRRPQTPGVYPARCCCAGELWASGMPNNGLPVCANA